MNAVLLSLLVLDIKNDNFDKNKFFKSYNIYKMETI